MKHLLNELSDSEKNRILEQYNNSLIVETKKFNKFINSKLGNVKPLINERDDDNIVQQHLRQTHSPYQDYWDEFPFPEKEDKMDSEEEEDEEDIYLDMDSEEEEDEDEE
jgi:hypothetical protein